MSQKSSRNSIFSVKRALKKLRAEKTVRSIARSLSARGLRLEGLEDKRLLAITYGAPFTPNADTVVLKDLGSDQFDLSGTTQTGAASAITLNADGGADNITIDSSIFNKVSNVSYELVINGQGGNDTIIIDDAAGNNGLDLTVNGGGGALNKLQIKDGTLDFSGSANNLILTGVSMESSTGSPMISIGAVEPDTDIFNANKNSFSFTAVPAPGSFFIKNNSPGIVAVDLEDNNLSTFANEDQVLKIGLVADNRSIVSASATNGTVVINGDGTVSYTPFVNFTGADTLTYTMSSVGTAGSSATGAVAITVNPVDDAPVNSLPSAYLGTEDTALVLSGPSLGVGDVDSSNLTVTLSVASGSLTLDDAVVSNALGGPLSGASITFTGTVSQINAVLQDVATPGLKYVPTADVNVNNLPGTVLLTMTTSDFSLPLPLVDSDTSAITISPVNDAPNVNLSGVPAISITEDSLSPVGIPSIKIDDDALPGQLTSLSLSVTKGTLDIDNAAAGFATVTGDGTSSVQVVGKSSEVAAVLAGFSGVGLKYSPNANAFGTDTLTITVNDQGNDGGGIAKVDTDTVSITINPVNDGPVNVLPGSQTTNEDVPLSIGGIVISDIDAGALATVSVTLTAVNGKVSTTAPLPGGPLAVLTLGPDTLANINAALGTLVFTPDANYSGPASITVLSNDGGSTGGGALTDTDTLSITVNAINDAPVISAPGTSQTFAEDIPGPIPGVKVNDVDGNDSTVTLQVANGTLTVGPTGGLTSFSGIGTGTVILTGPENKMDLALAGLTYSPNGNYFGPDALVITANDLGNTGSPGPQISTKTVVIAVNAVNDTPVNKYNGVAFGVTPTVTLVEDTSFSFNSGNSALLSTSDIDVGAANMRVQVTVGSGLLTVVNTAGVTFPVLANQNNTASVIFEGPLSSVNSALNGLKYVPNLGFNATDVLTLSVSDLGNTGPTIEIDSDTVNITVTGVDDAPDFVLGGTQLHAEPGSNTAVTVPGFLTGLTPGVGDPDTIVFPLSVSTTDISGYPGGLFAVLPAIDNFGNLTYTLAADAFGTATVQVTATDSADPVSLSTTKAFLIIVAPQNDAPEVNFAAPTVTTNEDTSITLSVANTNEIRIRSASNVALNEDSSVLNETIKLKLSAQFGTLTLSSVAGLTFSSGDGTADGSMEFTGKYNAIKSVLDGGVTYTPNADHNNTRSGFVTVGDKIKVEVDDLGHTGGGLGLTDVDSLPVVITPVNDIPTLIASFADLSRNEDAAPDTIALGATLILGSNYFDDADKLDVAPDSLTITSSIVSTSNPLLLSANVVGSDLKITYNTDQSGTATIKVTATDLAGKSVSDEFVVVVNAFNDLPTITHSDTPDPLWLVADPRQSGNDEYTNEDVALVFDGTPPSGSAIVIGDAEDTSLTASLSVQHGTLTFMATPPGLTFVNNGTASVVVSGPTALINAALLQLKYQPSPDFNNNPAINDFDPLVISVTDSAFQTTSQTVEIHVQPVNDRPVAVADAFTVQEGSSLNVLLVRTNDTVGPADESAQTIKVLVLSGPTSSQGGTIAIGPTVATGLHVVYTPPTPDFAGTDTFQYILQDSGGTANGGIDTSLFGTVTVTVAAVNDAPVITGTLTGANEDTPISLSPLGISDADGNVPVTVTLTSTNGSFTITPTVGVTIVPSGTNVTITGPINAIDTALNTSSYVPAANYNGSETVTITVNDNGNTGVVFNPLSDTESFVFAIAAVNDAPTTAFNPAPVVVPQNTTGSAITYTLPGFVAPTDGDPEVVQAVTIGAVSPPSVAGLLNNVTINGAGTLSFDVVAGSLVGPATFTVLLSDTNTPSAGLGGPASSNPSFTINVGINQEPTAAQPANINVNESASNSIYTFPNHLTGVGTGVSPDSPGGQAIDSVTISVVSLSNPSLFLIAPSIINFVPPTGPSIADGHGDLQFVVAANQVGSATVQIAVKDTGGIASGGDDTVIKTFTINVANVNDPPSFNLIGNPPTVNEDAGAQSVPGFAFNINPGIGDGGQTVTFTTGTSNPGLFSTLPSIDSAGTLTYTPAANANGSAIVTVFATDNGVPALSSGSQTFLITVSPVNDAPSFTLVGSPDQTVVEDSGSHSAAVVASISPGPADEAGQTVSFTVTNTNSGLFSVQPTVSPAGVLSYTLNADANGSATVSITAVDSLAASSAAQSLTITVTPVNDAPTVANLIADQTATAGGAFNFAVPSNTFADVDLPGDTLTLSASLSPSGALPAWLSFSGGVFSGTPGLGDVGSFTVRVVATDSGAATAFDDFVITVAPPATQPRVTSMQVGSTSWTAPYRNFLATNGLGTADGYNIPTGANQSKALPWTNLNQITVNFSEDVSVQQQDLVLKGVNVGTYGFSNFTYVSSPGVHKATWTLSSVIGADVLLVDLDGDDTVAEGNDGVRSTFGVLLDGEWANGTDTYDSGNGVAGGDFEFRFNVLPGNVTDAATINPAVIGNDLLLVRNNQVPLNMTNVLFDVNGNGFVAGDDVTLVKNRQFTSLPTGPAPSGAPIPGSVASAVDQALSSSDDGAGDLLDSIVSDVRRASRRRTRFFN